MKLDQKYKDLYEMAHNESYADSIRALAKLQLDEYVRELANIANSKKGAHVDTLSQKTRDAAKNFDNSFKHAKSAISRGTLRFSVEAGMILRRKVSESLIDGCRQIMRMDSECTPHIRETRSFMSSTYEIEIENLNEEHMNSVIRWARQFSN